MALASLFGGLALANSRLGAVHGFAGVLGGMYPAPHGIVCARLLPYVMETNVLALLAQAARSPYLARYDEVAQLVTGHVDATAADGVAWVQELCAALHVPGLAQYGVTEADFGEIVAKSQVASSMKGNPIALSEGELNDILRRAL
jgi:alcohol dehydrogenase class IV